MSSLPDDLVAPRTVQDIVTDIGLIPRPDEDVILAVIDAGESPSHYTVRRLADRDPANAHSLYVASGTFRQGSVSQWVGRSQENVSRVIWLPFDADLADWLQFPDDKSEAGRAAREREYAWLRSMSDDELAPYLAGQREDIEEVFAKIGLPIHRLDYTGYGHCAYVYVAPEDQHRVEDAKAAHKQLIRAINELARPVKLVDPQVSDPGTRITRLPGSVNRKGPIPRLVRTLAFPGGSVPLGQRPKTIRPTATFVPRDGEGLSSEAVDALVSAIGPSWTLGQKHAMGLAVGGIFAKVGIPESQAIAIVERLAAGDDSSRDRIKAVARSYDRVRSGLDVRGFYSLRKMVPADTLATVDGILKAFKRPVPPKEELSLTSIGESQAPVVPVVIPWPALDEAALHGLAGDVVLQLAPHTEADDVATLVTFLVLFGCACNRAPHFYVGEGRHGANLFAVLVGDTSKARKGTSLDGPKRLVGMADGVFVAERFIDGLSSGEGLIWQVHDAVTKSNKQGEEFVETPAVVDKRLVCVEEEFANLLGVSERQGNTISPVVRRAWDARGVLASTTRNSPAKATNPHIAIVGHITSDELKSKLTDTAIANGLGNRFLWFLVRRSKELPHPGRIPDEVSSVLSARIGDALEFARTSGEFSQDQEAWDLWSDVYGPLSQGKPGLSGALMARAEAQVLRLSLVYAILDGMRAIGANHLRSALALWGYCEASIHYIFGEATGNAVADRILTAVRTNGTMAQSDISELFGRNVGAAPLSRAIETLVSMGRIRSEREETGGRPRTVWRAVP